MNKKIVELCININDVYFKGKLVGKIPDILNKYELILKGKDGNPLILYGFSDVIAQNHHNRSSIYCSLSLMFDKDLREYLIADEFGIDLATFINICK